MLVGLVGVFLAFEERNYGMFFYALTYTFSIAVLMS